MRAKPAKVMELTGETIDARLLLKVLTDFRRGDFRTRLPGEQICLTGKIYDALNEVIDMNERMAKEFDRVANVVGKEGRIKQRASLSLATGSWAACIDSINTLIADLVQPTTEVARVIGAVAKGDLSQTMALEIEGRPLYWSTFNRNEQGRHVWTCQDQG
jgi:HAMP domain